MRIKRALFIFLILILLPRSLVAQLDNRALSFTDSTVVPGRNKLQFNLSVLAFNKNNEYFNRIADGYTLFGYHFRPGLTFWVNDHISLYGGLFTWQDFGNDRFTEVQPEFRIEVRGKQSRLLFGDLQGNLAHRMIEPMYGFERLLTESREQGLQYIYTNKWLWADAWVNWEDMLYRGEPRQERLSVGLSSSILLVDQDPFEVTLPVQVLVYHKGGQIDASPLPLTTVWNGAYGISFSMFKSDNAFFRGLNMEHYFLHYHDLSRTPQSTFQNGFAAYLNLTLKTAITDMMVSYWFGYRYHNPYGNAIYNSVSSTYKHPDHTEETRPLLVLRFMKDIKLAENLFLVSRFEPHWDFNNARIDFSHGLYITYKTHFPVKDFNPAR